MTLRLRLPRFYAVPLVCLTAAVSLCRPAQQAREGQASTPPPQTQTTPPPAPAIDKNAPELTTKDAPAVFKTRVDMVSVPVVVRDSKGRLIPNLTKENFQIFDKGKPQEIIRFVVEKSGDETAKAAKTVDTGPAAAETAVKPPETPERFIAYFFDDMHLAWPDLARSRDAVSRQLAKLPKTDRAAIFTTSGQNTVEFTDDFDKLQETLLKLRNRSISPTGSAKTCPDISFYMADLIANHQDTQSLNLAAQEEMICAAGAAPTPEAAQEYVRGLAEQVVSVGEQETHVTLNVFKDVVRRMSAMPGQRIVVLISPGFITTGNYLSEKNDVINHAIKSNVVINSLDARGLWTDPAYDASQQSTGSLQYQLAKTAYDHIAATSQGDVLGEIAYGTGGAWFQNNNDLDSGVRQLATVPDFFYVVGFAPQNLKLDGSFHPLKVTVKSNPPVSVNIQARRGYYSPRKASTAEETAKAEIEEAVYSREEMTDLPVELHTQYFKASDKDATLAVVCRMDPRRIQFRKTDGRNVNILTVVSAVFDRNGNFLSAIVKTVDIKMKDATMTKLMSAGVMTLKTNFSVPPGSYLVRLVVRDSEGQLMSALNGAVAIQ